MGFKFKEPKIEGLMIVEPDVIGDNRGFFVETYKAPDFRKGGIRDVFVQDNHSRSAKGVLRGLHYQREPFAQAKLVRCVRGEIFDVAVDLRKGSKTFGKWFGIELSESNKKMLYIPSGFAHGFVALKDGTEIIYKCSKVYAPKYDAGIRWDDPELEIKWPIKKPKLSTKDSMLPLLKDAHL